MASFTSGVLSGTKKKKKDKRFGLIFIIQY